MLGDVVRIVERFELGDLVWIVGRFDVIGDHIDVVEIGDQDVQLVRHTMNVPGAQ